MDANYDVNKFRNEPVHPVIGILTNGYVLTSSLIPVVCAWAYFAPATFPYDFIIKSYYSLVG